MSGGGSVLAANRVGEFMVSQPRVGSARNARSLARWRSAIRTPRLVGQRGAQAKSKSSDPLTIAELAHATGEPDLLAPADPASDSTITPTVPRPSSQPKIKAGPLTRALAA